MLILIIRMMLAIVISSIGHEKRYGEVSVRWMLVVYVIIRSRPINSYSGISGLTILSDGQVHVLDSGEVLTLGCQFQASNFNLFDCPVLWRKSQQDEETQINILGNINEPFIDGNRFEVSFVALNSIYYRLDLNIIDMQLEDSGNYTCEVRGPHSVILGQVIHSVYVRAPVTSLVLSDTNISAALGSLVKRTTPTTIELIENRPTTLRCESLGGYPPPNLELFIGSRDVTAEFHFTNSLSLFGRRGLRRIKVQTERWTHSYLPKFTDDKERFKCIAVVPGLKPYTQFTQLSVQFSPKISCISSEAYLQDKNANIKCSVTSKPRQKSFFWIIDLNGTTLSHGDVIDGCWALVHVNLYVTSGILI